MLGRWHACTITKGGASLGTKQTEKSTCTFWGRKIWQKKKKSHWMTLTLKVTRTWISSGQYISLLFKLIWVRFSIDYSPKLPNKVHWWTRSQTYLNLNHVCLTLQPASQPLCHTASPESTWAMSPWPTNLTGPSSKMRNFQLPTQFSASSYTTEWRPASLLRVWTCGASSLRSESCSCLLPWLGSSTASLSSLPSSCFLVSPIPSRALVWET